MSHEIQTHLTQAVDFDRSDLSQVMVSLYPAGPVPLRPDVPPGGPPDCLPKSLECYVTTPDGNYAAWVRGSKPLSMDDLRHILAGLRFATVSDPSTWFPVADAVPGGSG